MRHPLVNGSLSRPHNPQSPGLLGETVSWPHQVFHDKSFARVHLRLEIDMTITSHQEIIERVRNCAKSPN